MLAHAQDVEARDLETIRGLAEDGNDLSLPARIAHFCMFAKFDDAVAAGHHFVELGFKDVSLYPEHKSQLNRTIGPSHATCLVTQQAVLNQEYVQTFSKVFDAAARAHNGIYTHLEAAFLEPL